MPQDQFRDCVEGVRAYRKFVVNANPRGMIQFLADTGLADPETFNGRPGLIERLWKGF
jgi:hypothetical protein